MNKLVLNFTPTGMIPTKEQTSNVPVRTAEIIAGVRSAYEIGISMVHLHARNPEDGKPSYRKEMYAEIISGIRTFASDLIICVSTSGRNHTELSNRSEVLDLTGDVKPDMASLTLSSLNFNRTTSVNEPSTIMALAEKMQEKGILPELEVFDLGMVNYAHYLIRKGFIEPPYYFNIISGNISCAQAKMLHLGTILSDIPADSVVSIGGVGDYQLAANTLAISQGLGVRVGLEDNIWFDEQRTRLATNDDLVKRIHEIGRVFEREIMKPTELRAQLGLKPGYGQYGKQASRTDG